MLKATKSFNTPEIDAIRVILEKKSMDVIPVDLIDEDPLDRRQDSMFELFREKYREYYCASEIHVREIYEKGFPYLNSNDSDQIFRDMDSMRRIFVSYANHFQLSKTHKDWLDLNDKRENHWINAIHDYFERNKISSAVFLVGSAHRIRLMDKVKNLQANIPSWDFYPFKT